MAEDNNIRMRKMTPTGKVGGTDKKKKPNASPARPLFNGGKSDSGKGTTLQKESAPCIKKTKLKNGMTVMSALGRNCYFDATGKPIDKKTFENNVGVFKVNRSGRYTITSADGKTTKYYAANGTELKKEYYLRVENQSRSLDSRISQVSANLRKAEESNGVIGKLWSGFKNLTGIGDSSDKVRDQLDRERELLRQLNSNPTQANKAKIFQELTGVSYSPENEEKFNKGQIKLKSEQKLEGYKEGQATAVDVASDLGSGVASFAVAGFALTAAPVTGGASLLLLPAVGAGTKIGLKYIDAKTGGRKYDSLRQDIIMGSVNGAIAPFTAGAGGAVAKSIMAKTGVTVLKQAAKQTVTTAAKQTLKKSTVQVAKKGLLQNFSANAKEAMCYKFVGGTLKNRIQAYAIQGAVDGALSGAAYGGVETAINGGDAGDIAKATLFGAAGGAVFGAAMNGGIHFAGEKLHAPKPQGTNGLTEEIAQDAVPASQTERGIFNSEVFDNRGKIDFKKLSDEDLIKEYQKTAQPNPAVVDEMKQRGIGLDGGITKAAETETFTPSPYATWRSKESCAYIRKYVDKFAAEGKCDAQQFYKFLDAGVEPNHAFNVLEEMISDGASPSVIKKVFSDETLTLNKGKIIHPENYESWYTRDRSRFSDNYRMEFWNSDGSRKILQFDSKTGEIVSVRERVSIAENIDVVHEIDKQHNIEVTQKFKMPEKDELANPQILEENVTFKDSNGNIIYTEQTRLNETGQYEVKHIYPNGKSYLEGHVEHTPDGGILSDKVFTSPAGYKTKQAVITDKNGNFTLREIITDSNGKKISEVKKTYKKLSENKTQSKINDTTYTAEFSNDKIIVTEVKKDGTTSKAELVIVDDIQNTQPKASEILVDKKVAFALKDITPDQLMNMKKSDVRKISFDYNNRLTSTAGYDHRSKTLIIGQTKKGEIKSDASLLTHEIGHAIDDINGLTRNPELKKIFEEEKAELIKLYPDAKLENMEYHIIDYYDIEGRGLAESFADTNSFQSGLVTESGHKMRNMDLTHHFARTRAKMNELRTKALNGEQVGPKPQGTSGIHAGEEFDIPKEVLDNLTDTQKAIFMGLDADMQKGLLEYPDQIPEMLAMMQPQGAPIASHAIETQPSALTADRGISEALTELDDMSAAFKERIVALAQNNSEIELATSASLIKSTGEDTLSALNDDELSAILVGFTQSQKGHAPNTLGGIEDELSIYHAPEGSAAGALDNIETMSATDMKRRLLDDDFADLETIEMLGEDDLRGLFRSYVENIKSNITSNMDVSAQNTIERVALSDSELAELAADPNLGHNPEKFEKVLNSMLADMENARNYLGDDYRTYLYSILDENTGKYKFLNDVINSGNISPELAEKYVSTGFKIQKIFREIDNIKANTHAIGVNPKMNALSNRIEKFKKIEDFGEIDKILQEAELMKNNGEITQAHYNGLVMRVKSTKGDNLVKELQSATSASDFSRARSIMLKVEELKNKGEILEAHYNAAVAEAEKHGISKPIATNAAPEKPFDFTEDFLVIDSKANPHEFIAEIEAHLNAQHQAGKISDGDMEMYSMLLAKKKSELPPAAANSRIYAGEVFEPRTDSLDNLFELDFAPPTTKEIYDNLPDYMKKAFKESDLMTFEPHVLQDFDVSTIDIVRTPENIDHILSGIEREYGTETKNKFTELINGSPQYRKYFIENSKGRAQEFGQKLWGKSWEVNAADIREKLAQAQTYKEIEALERRLKNDLSVTPFPEHFEGIDGAIAVKRDELAAQSYTHMDELLEGQRLPSTERFKQIISKQIEECENFDELNHLKNDLAQYRVKGDSTADYSTIFEQFSKKSSTLTEKRAIEQVEQATTLRALDRFGKELDSEKAKSIYNARRAEMSAKLEAAYNEFKSGKSIPSADTMEDIVVLKLENCKTLDDLKPILADIKQFNELNKENIMLVRAEGRVRAKGDEIRTGLLADFAKRADECTTKEEILALKKEFRAYKKSDDYYKNRKLAQYSAHRRGEDNYQDQMLDIYKGIDDKINAKARSFEPEEKIEWYIDPSDGNLKKKPISQDNHIYAGEVFEHQPKTGLDLDDDLQDIITQQVTVAVPKVKKQGFFARLFSRSKSEVPEIIETPKYQKVEFPKGHKYTAEDMKLELESYFADSPYRDAELHTFAPIFKHIEHMDLENAALHIEHIKTVFKADMHNNIDDIVKHGYFDSKEGAEIFEYFAKRYSAKMIDYKRSDLDIVLSRFDTKNFKKAQERGLLENMKGNFRSIEETNRVGGYTDKQFAMYKEFKAKNIEFVSENDDINRLFLKYGEGKYPFELQEIDEILSELGDEKVIKKITDKLIEADNPQIIKFIGKTKDAKYIAENIEKLTILDKKLRAGNENVSIPDDFDWGTYGMNEISHNVYENKKLINQLFDIMDTNKFTNEQLYEIGTRMNEHSSDFCRKIALDDSLSPQEVLDIINGTRFIYSGKIYNLELSQKLELYNRITGFNSKLKAACEKHGLDLEPHINELTEIFDKKIPTIAVDRPQQQAFYHSVLGNNNTAAHQALTQCDFAAFGKNGLPLKYSRENFCKKINKIINNLSEEEQNKILKHFGLERSVENGDFDGILNIRPYTDKNGNIATMRAAESVRNEIEKFTKQNEILIKDKELKAVLDDLINGFPEFTFMIGKKQHTTHDYSLDIHTLKVLQSAMKDPKYATLTDAEKTIIKISALMHDMGKKGHTVDTGHEILSTDYVKALLEKHPFPKEMKQRIIHIVKNHHWFADFNTGKTDATDVALMFRNGGDLKIAEILAKADFENVSKDFHFEKIPVKPTQENFEMYMNQQFAKVEVAREQINRHAAPVYADRFTLNGEKFPKKRMEVNGVEKEMGVLNLNELEPNTPMEQFGYAPGVTSSNMTYVAHFAEDASTLETVLKVTGNPHKDSVWSAGVFNSGDTRSYGGRQYCVIFDYEQANVVDAANQSLQSGYQKDITNVRHHFDVLDKWNRSSGVEEAIKKSLKKSGIKLNNQEYSQLADYLYSKKFTTQFRKDIEINGKKIDAQTLQNASDDVKKYLLSAEEYNEIELERPLPAALGIKAKTIEEVPQWFKNMADKYGLKMILLP